MIARAEVGSQMCMHEHEAMSKSRPAAAATPRACADQCFLSHLCQDSTYVLGFQMDRAMCHEFLVERICSGNSGILQCVGRFME